MADDDLLIVAGEASGDLHGARMLEELLRLEPEVRAFGLGGDELQALGLDSVAHSAEISVVGLTEVFGVLRRARQVFAALLREVDRRRPALAVLIDSPEFNLRLAKQLNRRGVRVVYYISPQIWAWRRRRIRQIARRVEKMLVLFSFEREFYRRHGVEATHVGHPLVDVVPEQPHVWDAEGTPEVYQVALLPGSRRSEIGRMLPVLLDGAEALAQQCPVAVRLIRAPTVPRELLTPHLESRELEVVDRDRFRVLAESHLALCASGTATLETGLVGTPMVVVYRVGRWTGYLGRLLVDLPAFSLVNLVLGRRVVPELFQGQVTPNAIRDQALRILREPAAVGEMRAGLAELRGALGSPGASGRAAAEVQALLRREAVA